MSISEDDIIIYGPVAVRDATGFYLCAKRVRKSAGVEDVMKKICKRLTVMFLAAAMFAMLASCGKKSADDNGEKQSDNAGTEDGEHAFYHVEFKVKDYGTIKVELDATAAPITVENFVKLANGGFYDGLTFHRVDDGFMIQGGDPLGNGRGGSGETIKGEFALNCVKNTLSHTRGAISMARSSISYDSASSQFFIVQEDSTFLDGGYACFGYVTEGMEVVDAICKAVPVEDEDTCMVSKENQPVIESVKVIDSPGQ